MGSPRTSEAQLAHAKGLDFEKAKGLLHSADIESMLAREIARASADLRNQDAVTTTELNAKFANEASFELAVGNLDVFYGGLEKLVGSPRMRLGSNPSPALSTMWSMVSGSLGTCSQEDPLPAAKRP